MHYFRTQNPKTYVSPPFRPVHAPPAHHPAQCSESSARAGVGASIALLRSRPLALRQSITAHCLPWCPRAAQDPKCEEDVKYKPQPFFNDQSVNSVQQSA